MPGSSTFAPSSTSFSMLCSSGVTPGPQPKACVLWAGVKRSPSAERLARQLHLRAQLHQLLHAVLIRG
ncbi:hypothetical protein StrepF001_20870 [Streptomyces sp. F001]|nr:hypothetical protein StrepF001_20870 [Streptomyces sp. F001]